MSHDEFEDKTDARPAETGERPTGGALPPCLILQVGPSEYIGRQWMIQKPKHILGRAPPADIQIEDGRLSKMHAQFETVNGQVMITDLGSTNKTKVNGKELVPNEAHPLKNGDKIRAGNLAFQYLHHGILSEADDKARMQAELETARSVQASLFPATNHAHYEFVQIGGRYRTATECGGDWWWHWRSGQFAFAIIADATGHGAGAAMLTSAARSAVAALEDSSQTTVENVFLTLTRAIAKCANGALAMSAFLVEINLTTRRLRYINASHPWAVWLLRDLPVEADWKSLPVLTDGKSAMLGLPDPRYSVGECTIPPGARLLLLTDGLIERVGGSNLPLENRRFFPALMQTHRSNPLDQAAFLDRLLEESDKLAQMAPLKDDITVVALDFGHTAL